MEVASIRERFAAGFKARFGVWRICYPLNWIQDGVACSLNRHKANNLFLWNSHPEKCFWPHTCATQGYAGGRSVLLWAGRPGQQTSRVVFKIMIGVWHVDS